jgi:ABC-type dipeptide/oligopeptide/nickel transport system permease subunit
MFPISFAPTILLLAISIIIGVIFGIFWAYFEKK